MEYIFSHYGLILSYIMFIVALLLALVLPLIYGNRKGLLSSLIWVGILAVLFVIGYALSGDEVTLKYSAFNITAFGSKMIGGVLIMMYIMFAVSLIGIVYNEISRLLK